jgi:DNA-binding response OmpR family regulator
MINSIKGISNINLPVICDMLPAQLQKSQIDIFFTDNLTDYSHDTFDFLFIDADKFISQKNKEHFYIMEHLKQEDIVYGFSMKKDYKQKLQLLNLNFVECFEFPIMTDIIARTLKNQLSKLTKSQDGKELSDTQTAYVVNAQSLFKPTINIEFLLSKGNKWFLKYGRSAVYISRFEKRIIEYLLRQKKIATKTEIAYAGWNTFGIKSNTITVTIKNIRSIFATLGVPMEIRNIYGFGYCLEEVS